MASLQDILTENALNAKIINFGSSTHTAQEASLLLDCKLSQIIKSLVVLVIHKNKAVTPFLVLVSGDRKLRQTLVRKLLLQKGFASIKDSKLASPEEVKLFTGYTIGGVPPIVDKLDTILDEKILKESIVFGGGGTSSKILKIVVTDLVRFTNPITGNISKKI